jgi:hypothetical protein
MQSNQHFQLKFSNEMKLERWEKKEQETNSS